MTREELIKAFEMRVDGYSYRQIGEKLGYTKQNVSNLLNKVVKDFSKSAWVYPNLAREIGLLDKSVEEFCEEVRIRPNHFRNMVYGKTNPTGNDVFRCCEYLGKDCLYLFKRRGDNESNPSND